MVNYSKTYWKRVSDRNRIRGKRSQAIQRENRLTRELDADTLRQRAIYDRRGRLAFMITCDGETFYIQHSVCGRCDQYDVIYQGEIVTRIRLGMILAVISKQLANAQ